jgi:hypothetical protein
VVEGQEEKVFKLHKGLFGLRQAPRAWNEKLDRILTSSGFEKYPLEHAVYRRSKLVVGVYVGNLRNHRTK